MAEIAEVTHFRLHEPEIDGQDAHFRWEVTPRTELYLRNEFRISFPAQVDLAAVPRALWWRILLLCLHAHFAILRPCVVELPIQLEAAEQEAWRRLVMSVAAHLEAYGDAPRPGPCVELRGANELLPPTHLGGSTERVVAAFSGGKDSLVQAALAAEITEHPLLVMITSPAPWTRDHVGDARVRARNEIPHRLGVDVLEVTSDFRTCWDHGFSMHRGGAIAVHEVSDIPLYYSALAAVSAATGRGQKLLAAEAEAHYSVEVDGRTVMQPDAMSAAVMQRAVDVLLGGFGQRQGGLTGPLHAAQVQAIFLSRYRKLLDLQFSCFEAPEGERACSVCVKCFSIAVGLLSNGVSPREIGIDPVKALMAYADWHFGTPPGPGAFVTMSTLWSNRVTRALQRRSTDELRRLLASETDRRLGQALAVYARLRAEALASALPPEPGYVVPFLDFVPARLRSPVRGILAEHFAPTAGAEFTALAERVRGLSDWIVAPLAGQGRQLRRRAAA